MIDRLMSAEMSRPAPVARRPWTKTAVMVAGTLALAVVSYTVSLKVSAERAALDRVAADNRAIQAELRSMDAELRVRMRLPQLQRWNDEVLGLQPVSAQQFLVDPMQLASLGREQQPAMERDDVRLVSAPATTMQAAPILASAPAPRPAAGLILATAHVPIGTGGTENVRPAPVMKQVPMPSAKPEPKPRPAEASAPRKAAPRIDVAEAAAQPRQPAASTDKAKIKAASAKPKSQKAPGGLDASLIAVVEQAAAREGGSQQKPVDLLRVAAQPGQ